MNLSKSRWTTVNHRGDSRSCLTTLRGRYTHGARERNLVFELTNKQFRELTKENCWYCGIRPAQICRNTGKQSKKNPDAYYLYNGIDRVDNTIGYTEVNCISCCGRCNRMKGTLHAEDFIIHIRKLARNMNIF